MSETSQEARRSVLGWFLLLMLSGGGTVLAQHAPRASFEASPGRTDAVDAPMPSRQAVQEQYPNGEKPSRNAWLSGNRWGQNPAPLNPLGRSTQQSVQPPAAPIGGSETSMPAKPVRIRADLGQQWVEQSVEGHLLYGNCVIVNGETTFSAEKMVLWRQPTEPTQGSAESIVAYLEGQVEIRTPDRVEREPTAIVRLAARSSEIKITRGISVSSRPDDPVVKRAVRSRAEMGTEVAQREISGPALGGGAPPASWIPREGVLKRQVTIYPRYAGIGYSLLTFPSTDTVPPEYITTITGGVRIVIDGLPIEVDGQLFLTTLDLAADRAVIWTDAERIGKFSNSLDLDGQTPFEVFLEGNIVVRQGANTLRATHAFYDIRTDQGLLWNGELRSVLPESDAVVRLRASKIRQLSRDRFHAQQAWVTTSEMGIPGYRIEASDIFLERRPAFGQNAFDPITGKSRGGVAWVTSEKNRFYIENIPIAATPYLSSPVENPDIPLRKLSGGYDSVLGAQLRTVWDAEAIFGLDLDPSIDWDLRADFFSKRGPAAGTDIKYDLFRDVFGIPIHTLGEGSLYYLNDGGNDRLGQQRNSLPFPNANRGRAVWRSRTYLPFNIWLQSELGYLSDRNVLEQFWEPEWDSGKDYENYTSINHQIDNLSASLIFRGRLNDFENTTSWLPRLDLTLLSEPVGGTPLLWSSRSSIGYGRIHQADAPGSPALDVFARLPYFVDREGVVAMTRHELDLPLHLGPINVVPYLLGEAAYWQEDLTGGDLTRLYGSAGVRASVMFSKFMPGVYSPILGLNGLAHKMVFDVDYSFSESSQSISRIAQYNEFDDNAQERFRQRFAVNEFGIPTLGTATLPLMFDPRYYAIRSGAGRSVSAPWHELIDDLHVVRLGWRHRWQTRVGPPQAPRIHDWMTLDLETSLFPNKTDNFGELFGLLSARYTWNVGARTKLLANAIYDPFSGGQRIWNAGVLSNRSGRGSFYFGYRQIEVGPISSQLLVASASYHPSDKWAWTFGTSYDIREGIDRGQSATITRIGEYLLFHVGLGYDRSRNNFGIGISVEPKFGSYRSGSTQLSSLLGVPQ